MGRLAKPLPGSNQREFDPLILRMKIVTWDWKQIAPIEEIAEVVHAVSGGLVHMRYAETGSDQIAIVVSREPITDEQADALWVERMKE